MRRHFNVILALLVAGVVALAAAPALAFAPPLATEPALFTHISNHFDLMLATVAAVPAEARRWTRDALAQCWNCSDRKIDRMRLDGRLGEPIGYIGRSPIWSEEQRLAAERAGLARHAERREATDRDSTTVETAV
jgi:hypothetical protein